MTHPLTDVFCEQHFGTLNEAEDLIFDFGDLRAAADWQLEQVMKWLNETIFERGCCLEAVNIPEELAEAMRPANTQEKS